MIIQTRYRDIPLEEAAECLDLDDTAGQAWSDARGSVVSIETPSIGCINAKCAGPFYRVADDEGGVICPHIAEIGD